MPCGILTLTQTVDIHLEKHECLKHHFRRSGFPNGFFSDPTLVSEAILGAKRNTLESFKLMSDTEETCAEST